MMPDHAPRCYAVDDPATFPGDFGWPDICNSSFWPSTKIVCPTSIDASFELALERVARGEPDGWRRWCAAEPTTAAVTPGWCRDANGWASIDSDPYSRPKATP